MTCGLVTLILKRDKWSAVGELRSNRDGVSPSTSLETDPSLRTEGRGCSNPRAVAAGVGVGGAHS